MHVSHTAKLFGAGHGPVLIRLRLQVMTATRCLIGHAMRRAMHSVMLGDVQGPLGDNMRII
eukprot:3791426-Alexandrium_andersonii.AAC.1